MGIVWIAIGISILIVVLVYLRLIGRRHVAALFRATVHRCIAEGLSMEAALQKAACRFMRRPPFNRIQEDELAFFLCVLQDLDSPVEVGARILQQCEIKRDATGLKDPQKAAKLAYSIDFKLRLQQLIQDARILQQKAGEKHQTITVALLASLSARKDWIFAEDQKEALVFNYRGKSVYVPKQGSGKDAAKLILFEEMAHRPLMARQDLGFEIRNSARQDLVANFDNLFDEVFQNTAIWH